MAEESALRKRLRKRGRHPSAMKRARQAEKRRDRNRIAKGQMRAVVKEARTDQSAEKTQKAVKALYAAASKGVIHKRQAARKVSRLMAKQAKSAAK